MNDLSSNFQNMTQGRRSFQGKVEFVCFIRDEEKWSGENGCVRICDAKMNACLLVTLLWRLLIIFVLVQKAFPEENRRNETYELYPKEEKILRFILKKILQRKYFLQK